MPMLMRALSGMKRHTWTETIRNWPQWCPEGEVPAILLDGWADDSPSLYRIADDEANLENVICAHMKPRGDSMDLQALVFDEDLLQGTSLVTTRKDGNTGIQQVDRQFHFELSQMTADKVARLLACIIEGLNSGRARVRRWDKTQISEFRGRL